MSDPDAPRILILPPVLVGGTMVIGVLVHYWVWTVTPFPVLAARVVGFGLFVLAGCLAHWAQRSMRRAGTNIFPTQPALALVTDGPFRLTRNPLYIAAIGVYLGVSLWVDALVPLLLLLPMVVVLHRGIVIPEERYLEAKFGAAYSTYQGRVRRWL